MPSALYHLDVAALRRVLVIDMAKQKARFYAVGRGREVGVYHSWASCNEQVHGWSGARYRGFQTYEEANEFVMQHDWDYRLQHERRATTLQQQIPSCSGGGDSFQDAIVVDSDDDDDFDTITDDEVMVDDCGASFDDDGIDEELVESSLGPAVTLENHRVPNQEHIIQGGRPDKSIRGDGKSLQTAIDVEDEYNDRQSSNTHLLRGESTQCAIVIDSDDDDENEDQDSEYSPFEIHRDDGQQVRIIRATIRKKIRFTSTRSASRGGGHWQHRLLLKQSAKAKARSNFATKRAKILSAQSLSSIGTSSRPTLNQVRIIEVYTDGSCTKMGTEEARAGWGVYWPSHRDVNSDLYQLNKHGRVPGDWTTQSSNRAELLGLIRAVQTCPDDLAQLIIYTDSRNCIDAVNKWQKPSRRRRWMRGLDNAKRDTDYVRKLVEEMSKRSLRPILVWVKGHAEIPGNTEADRLAKMGRKLPTLPFNSFSIVSSCSGSESEDPEVGQHDDEYQDTSEAEILTSLT